MDKKSEIKIKYPLLFNDSENQKKLIRDRFNSAWTEAKRAAEILKDEFAADRVLVFGSLTDIENFTEKSDIDLAVSGISDEKFYAAVGVIIREIPLFRIDIVDMDDCKPYLKRAIEREGIEL